MLKGYFRKTHTEYTIGKHLIGLFWLKPYAKIKWRLIVIRAFILKRKFWAGLVIGLLVGLLYGWFGIWATYTSLEQADRERAEELEAIKKIIYFSEDIQSQHKESVDWNEQNMIPMPKWTMPEEEDEQ